MIPSSGFEVPKTSNFGPRPLSCLARPTCPALLSCGASPDHQILNPFNPHHRHDDAQAFFIMGKVIDKRLIGDEPPHHSNLNADFSSGIELSAEDVTGAGIRNHDEITRDFFRFESDNAPSGRRKDRPNGQAKPTSRRIVARKIR